MHSIIHVHFLAFVISRHACMSVVSGCYHPVDNVRKRLSIGMTMTIQMVVVNVEMMVGEAMTSFRRDSPNGVRVCHAHIIHAMGLIDDINQPKVKDSYITIVVHHLTTRHPIRERQQPYIKVYLHCPTLEGQ